MSKNISAATENASAVVAAATDRVSNYSTGIFKPVRTPLTTLPTAICVLIVQFLPNLDHQALTERLKYFLTTPPGVGPLEVDLGIAEEEDSWYKSISPQRD